jgi:hypothetical protein
MPRGGFDALRLELAGGDRVHVFGRPELYQARGVFQLRALSIATRASSLLPSSTWSRFGGNLSSGMASTFTIYKEPRPTPDRTSYPTRERAATGIRELFFKQLRTPALGACPVLADTKGEIRNPARW